MRSMTNPDSQSGKTPISRHDYKRPSERIFRRSRKARARRRKSDRSDFRFISAMLQLSVLAALMLVLVGVWMQKSLTGTPVDVSGLAGLVEPWAFGLTRLEAGGIAILIIWVSAVLIWKCLKASER